MGPHMTPHAGTPSKDLTQACPALVHNFSVLVELLCDMQWAGSGNYSKVHLSADL